MDARRLPFTAATVAAILALSAGFADARSKTPPAQVKPAAASATANNNPLAGEDLTRLKGATVFDADAEKVGTIADVLINPKTKVVDRLVIDQSGIPGSGVGPVAVPVASFSWDDTIGSYRIKEKEDQLLGMKRWTSPPQLAAAPN